jgi:hypothetical protein
MPTQQFQVIGDITRATAKLTTHARDQKGHAQRMNAIWQDVVFELSFEDCDRIESD